MQRWIGGFLVISSMGLISTPALANCETSSASTLTCNSARNTEVDWNLFDSIAGLFDSETFEKELERLLWPDGREKRTNPSGFGRLWRGSRAPADRL